MRILWFCLTAVLLFSGSVQAMGLEGDSVLGELDHRVFSRSIPTILIF